MVNFSDYLVTDDLTILLALIAATVFLLHNFYKPQALVHPILLGRQSDVARVRNSGESAVARNYGTGMMGRLPLRPSKDVHILADFIKADQDAPRTLWSTKITNPGLQDRIAAFGTGLLRLANVQPQESNVLLLLNDSIEFLIADLALASHSIPSLTLSTAALLSSVLESHPPSAIIANAEILPQLLELIYDDNQARHHTIIVVGQPSAHAMATVASQVKVLLWPDVEREGFRVEKIISPIPQPSDVFNVTYFPNHEGQVQAIQFTHENMTAGVASTRALVPATVPLSSLDTVVSAFSLSHPFGRSIAYTALYEGTNFATLDSTKLFRPDDSMIFHNMEDVSSAQKNPIPSPTVLFVKPGHLRDLAGSIMKEAKKSGLLFSFAWRHKVAAVREGFLTKDSLWDRLVFDAARAKVIGDAAGTLRAMIVSGGSIPTSALTSSRVAFSTAFVNAYSHPFSTGPIFASHPQDLQDFGDALDHDDPGRPAPTGPPTVNIEAKLTGVIDAALESGGDPQGALHIRGPTVGKLTSLEDYVNVSGSNTSADDADVWLATGAEAKLHTNGSFRVLENTI